MFTLLQYKVTGFYLFIFAAHLLNSNYSWQKNIPKKISFPLHLTFSDEQEISNLLESTVFKDISFSVKDIQLEHLLDGSSSRFKCSVKNMPSAYLIKYAPPGDGGRLLSAQRLKFDYEGVTAFSRYTPAFVPVVYAYNPGSGIAIYEYLDNFQPLQQLLESGEVPADVSRFIGTVMGRNHGRTHKAAVLATKTQKYITAFSNQPNSSSLLWAAKLDHLLKEMEAASRSDYVPLISHDDDPFSQSPMDLLLQLDRDGASFFIKSLRILSEIYASKMETLIHGELDASNILFRERRDDDAMDGDGPAGIALKVVDFEGCRFGAAGVDLGMFLGSFVSFYAAHSLSAPRRNLLGQVAAVIDAYRVSFRIQFEATSRKTGPAAASATARDFDTVLQNILADAVGIAAAAVLLQAIEPDPQQPHGKTAGENHLERVMGCNWGDVTGKQRSVRRRMVRIAGQLLQLFLLHQQRPVQSPAPSSPAVAPSPPSISADSVVKALRMDDVWLSSDHYTEFWSL